MTQLESALGCICQCNEELGALPSGQSTDAFLGSDIMIEDFLGYNGRIMDMKMEAVK